MAHDVNPSEMDVAAQVRSALISKVSAERFDLWIPESTRWSFTDGNLTLWFESDAYCQFAKRNLTGDVAEVSRVVCGADVEINFQVGAARKSSAASSTDEASEENQPAGQPTVDKQSSASKSSAGKSIRNQSAERKAAKTAEPDVQLPLQPTPANAREPQQTNGHTGKCDAWSRFITGRSSQLAWAAAKMVVTQPGEMNPVLVHGPTGAGKSLLADAITEQLRTTRRMRRVVQLTSEQFTNDFTEGLRGGGLPMFRRKYRDVEALVLEDIQFLAGKKATLTEVKHTIDNLVKLGKQVVLTADRSLNELSHLGNELIVRIRGGLVTPIYPLDEDTRLALLTRETRKASVPLPTALLESIASRVTGDGRVISGIVKRLTAVSRLADQDLDWDCCWTAISDLIQATQPVVRIVDIERVVCDVFGLDPNCLQSESKVRNVSQPRMLAMFLARKYTPAAYKEIGNYFGRRRHSTVISAEKTVESWLQNNSSIRLGRGLSVREAIRHVESQLQVG